ncbi:MAG: hypothetical protein IK997_07000 [Bacilli bacterium]|nr:hypothetical protein [Clostridia bacterium]MBP3841846.1 hypothetical protein [Bacilli bacterium]
MKNYNEIKKELEKQATIKRQDFVISLTGIIFPMVEYSIEKELEWKNKNQDILMKLCFEYSSRKNELTVEELLKREHLI